MTYRKYLQPKINEFPKFGSVIFITNTLVSEVYCKQFFGSVLKVYVFTQGKLKTFAIFTNRSFCKREKFNSILLIFTLRLPTSHIDLGYFPVGIYLLKVNVWNTLKVNNRNVRMKSLTSSWCLYCYFEQISQIVLVFPMLTLNK